MTSEAPTRAEDIEALIVRLEHGPDNKTAWRQLTNEAAAMLRSLAALTVPPPRDTHYFNGAGVCIKCGHLAEAFDTGCRELPTSAIAAARQHFWPDAPKDAQQPPAPLDYTPIFAQHDETGRLWSGPRCKLPRRYAEIAGDAPSAAGDDAEVEHILAAKDRDYHALAAQLASARAALQEIVDVLGPSEVILKCEGCEYEWNRALRVARNALGAKTGEGNG